MPSRPHLMVEPSWLVPILGDSLSPVHIPRLPRAGRSILAAVNTDSLDCSQVTSHKRGRRPRGVNPASSTLSTPLGISHAFTDLLTYHNQRKGFARLGPQHTGRLSSISIRDRG